MEFVRNLTVLKDPRSEGSLEDIKNQVELSLELRDAINLSVNMINTIEGIRSELDSLIPVLENEADIQEAKKLNKKAESIAGSLYDIHLTGAREDAFRSPMQLYGRLSSLASDLTGHGVDFKPTDQQREVNSIFNNKLKGVNEEFDRFIEQDVSALNEQLKKSKHTIDLGKKIKS